MSNFKPLFIALLALFLLTVKVSAATPAATFTVNSTADAADANIGNGICATATNVCTLRAAIEEANSNFTVANTINLPAGVYALTLGELEIVSSLTIQGATSGITEINGGANSQRIFRYFGTNGRLFTLSDVTLKRGTPSGGSGGVLFASGGGQIHWRNCHLTDNHIFPILLNATFGAMTIENCLFDANSSTLIQAFSGVSLTITNSTFRNNTLAQADSMAIFLQPTATATISDSTFENNTYTRPAITTQGTLTITRSTFSSNSNTLANSSGGAIQSLAGATTRIIDSTFDNNSAESGGAITVIGGTTTIIGSTFANNSATTLDGGAIISNGGTTIIDNSTLSGNTAKRHGGGLAVTNGSFAHLFSTTLTQNFANNTFGAAGNGGGIYISDATATSRNTIIAGNTDRGVGSVHADCSGNLASNGNNLFKSLTGCTVSGTTATNIVGDPLLDMLQDAGGPTQTHPLLVNSPAIDTGNSGRCCDSTGGLVLFDQRHAARPVDGDGNQTALIDIGSFERLGVPTAVQVRGISAESSTHLLHLSLFTMLIIVTGCSGISKSRNCSFKKLMR